MPTTTTLPSTKQTMGVYEKQSVVAALFFRYTIMCVAVGMFTTVSKKNERGSTWCKARGKEDTRSPSCAPPAYRRYITVPASGGGQRGKTYLPAACSATMRSLIPW